MEARHGAHVKEERANAKPLWGHPVGDPFKDVRFGAYDAGCMSEAGTISLRLAPRLYGAAAKAQPAPPLGTGVVEGAILVGSMSESEIRGFQERSKAEFARLGQKACMMCLPLVCRDKNIYTCAPYMECLRQRGTSPKECGTD